MDSGCSRHMTRDESKFAFLTKRKRGYVTFGDNAKGRIIGQGNIGNDTSSLIESVLLVDGLKHNLLSISQLCDKGFKVIFEASHCIIKDIQNGVVERKNRTLQEMARTMLNENNLPKYFWAEAVNTSSYVLNRILLRPILKKTPYELWKKQETQH